MDYTMFDIAELRADLADAALENSFLRKFRDLGSTDYHGRPIGEVIEINDRIIETIRIELERRGEAVPIYAQHWSDDPKYWAGGDG